ncbi:MAG: hypothetical protein K2X35_11965 [Bryobacteraceae bacterium]|nr:hypothetical protein [Bryobacteraceae bacterium]
MTKLLLSLVLSACLASAAGRVAIEGLDPVRLVEGAMQDGNPEWTEEYEGLTYQFASADTRAKFRQEPARYAAQLHGACARMGAPVIGMPESYHVYNGRIYLLGSSQCYKAFVADSAKYLESEQKQIAFTPTPETIARARKLWPGIAGSNIVVEHRLDQSRFYSSGGSLAVERSVQGRGLHQVTARDGSFSVYEGKVLRGKPAFSEAAHRAIRHDLLYLLLAPDLEMYHTGQKDGLEWIALKSGDVVTHAGLAADGAISRLEYLGRGPDSGFGQVAIRFSGYRETGGRKLPHRAEAFFNGEPVPQLGWSVEKYEWNPAGAEARFAPPAGQAK